MSVLGKPQDNEYGNFFAGYVSKVDSENIVQFLDDQLHEVESILGDLPDEQASVCHEPYTWTLKQLLGHLIDGEKVFGYRLHRMSCGDTTPLPGFDHEPYVENLDYQNVSIADLVLEFGFLRRSNIMFLKRLPLEAGARTGKASDCEFTVRGQAYIIGGHVQHHLNIMRERLSGQK